MLTMIKYSKFKAVYVNLKIQFIFVEYLQTGNTRLFIVVFSKHPHLQHTDVRTLPVSHHLTVIVLCLPRVRSVDFQNKFYSEERENHQTRNQFLFTQK